MGTTSSAPHEPLERASGERKAEKDCENGRGEAEKTAEGGKEKGKTKKRHRRMDRLRRSFRESFRKKKEHVPESSKPHQWQTDENSVRAGTCNFHVKYLGCVEVFESRGMQVCEEALKVLRNSRRRPVRGILHVSGDGLRVVDEETKGLIVDQTIEKVSFCAPDRNHDRGFSYICRDGTTRRWMCHGFFAMRESGERLSHAVGCAFAACLERKQKRDKECGVTMTFDPANSTFTRTGSFRQATLTERLADPQECKPAEPPPKKDVVNPYAIERPHATASLLQRQGSFRGFQQLNQASPFKRQLSLRLNELPSTLERKTEDSRPSNGLTVSPIPEVSPAGERGDAVSAMCQELSQGLSLLSSKDEDSSQTSPAPPRSPAPSPAVSHISSSSSLSRGDQWLATAATFANGKPQPQPAGILFNTSPPGPPPPRRTPPMAHLRSQSLDTAPAAPAWTCHQKDPFEDEWAALARRNQSSSSTTNPFLQSNTVKTFEIQM